MSRKSARTRIARPTGALSTARALRGVTTKATGRARRLGISPGSLTGRPLPAASYAGVPLWMFSRAHLLSALVAFGLVAAWCLFVLASPTRRCHCLPGKMRARCRKCRGHGRRYRRGATAIHRFAWSVLLRRLMNNRRDDLAEQRATRPVPPAGMDDNTAERDLREGSQYV